MGERPRVLHLWLAAAALDTDVKAWAVYGGSPEPAPPGTTPGDPSGEPRSGVSFDGPEPPYRTGVDAVDDGWALVQAPGPVGLDVNGELGCEFVFTRL